MPAFTFTSPEGKQYTVNGPDGATKEQAFQVLQQQLAGGTAQATSPADVPQTDAAGHYLPSAPPPAPADPSLVDRIIGGGETALALATGATTGAVGLAGGALAGIGKSVADGSFGTAKGADTAEQYAVDGMNKYTYQPRTQTGQDYTAAAGDAMNAALPAMMMPELAGAAAGAKAGARTLRETARNTAPALDAADAATVATKGPGLRDLVRAPKNTADAAVMTRLRAVAPELADHVQRTLERNHAPVSVDPDSLSAGPVDAAQFDPSNVSVSSGGDAPTMSGVGAAAVSKDSARAALFDKLGIEPTLGQLTRDPEQMGFERETAKTPEGKDINQRYAEQNAQVQRKFEEFADDTGAQVSDPRDVGHSVIDALEQKRDALKAEAKAAYDTADAAGEMQEPVDVTNLVTFIKANKGKDKIAPIISMIESELKQNSQPVGGNLDKLTLTPTPKRFVMPLKATEDLRQAINEAYEPNTPNNVWGSKAIRVLDAATEDKGGPLYRQARRIYENYSKQFVNRDVVARLLRTKPGTTDRVVAPEQVLHQTLLSSKGKDDVSHLFRVLEAHPANMDPAVVAAGQQAAANLRGSFVNHIRDQMFSNGGANALGDTVGSQKKIQTTVTNFDNRGVLKAVLGRSGAQTMRDLRDASMHLYTTPEGVINHSNNVGKFVAAIEKIEKHVKPIPGARHVANYAADRAREHAINKRIEKALNPRQKTAPGSGPINLRPARPSDATIH